MVETKKRIKYKKIKYIKYQKISIENNKAKTICIPTFNGDESNYQTWWVRFKAHTKVSGFEKALNIITELDLPTS